MELDELIASISLRPAMWVGTGRLRDVALFLDGFSQGVEASTGVNPMRGWLVWIETIFLVSHPAWHWTSIVQHQLGSESEALAALPQLFSRFKAETAGHSDEALRQRHRRAFLDAYGCERHAPAATPPCAV